MAGGGGGSHDKGLIHKPGSRMRKYIPLKFVSKHGSGKRNLSADLNLTSLVDMLTILVVFLLQLFSASGELLTIQKNIKLPDAKNFKDLEGAPIIAVSMDSVTLDGRVVASADQLKKDESADWKIVDLHDQLVTLKNNFKLLHPSDPFNGMVNVQADKAVDFKVIKKVMYTCGQAGYQNVNFAVQQKSNNPGG